MKNKKSFSLIVSLLKPHKSLLLLALLALAGGSAINLLLPEVVRRFLAQGSTQSVLSNPYPLAAWLLGLFAVQAVFFYFRHYFFAILGIRVSNQLRRDLYAAILERPLEFFDRHSAGDLVSRLTSDTLLVQEAVSIKLSVFIRYGFQVLAGIVLMCMISVLLTIAIVLTVPLLAIVSIVLGKKLKFYSRAAQAELGGINAIAEEIFSGMRLVKAYVLERVERLRLNSALDRLLDWGVKRTKVSAFFSSFVSFLMNACIVAVVLLGIVMVGKAQLSLADLSAFMLYGLIVAVSFAFIASGYTEFVQSLAAAERVFELLEGSGISALPGSPPVQPCRADLRFEKVRFAYPARPDNVVLDQVSFEVKPNQSTALVGLSGSGKSTIVNLVLKLYEPAGGAIYFDGKRLGDINPALFRERIALVPQEATLFGISIADNLRYGKLDATAEELEKVCARVGMLDFIRSLPEAFDTNVGRGGMKLSGGERQRLAIARALLRDPALLILDEATSALDSNNEALVQQALGELMRGRTVLVIAHRLATVKNADQVIVLSQGQVVQQGTHTSLAQAPGLYRELVEKQELLSAS